MRWRQSLACWNKSSPQFEDGIRLAGLLRAAAQLDKLEPKMKAEFMRIATLTGSWASTLEGVDRIYEFKRNAPGIVVCVKDSSDGELFVTRNQRISQNLIEFDLTTPSSGSTTRNRITNEKSGPTCRITYGDTWVRRNAPSGTRFETTPDKRQFLGEWTEEHDEVSTAVRFMPYGQGVGVEVKDKLSGNAMVVRNPRWASSTVRFRCLEPDGDSESWHQFSILGAGRAFHTVTLKDNLRPLRQHEEVIRGPEPGALSACLNGGAIQSG